MPSLWDPSVVAHELTVKEIEQLVEAMAAASALAREAGMDGIEITVIQAIFWMSL
jgi:2,4-dienoyl-CoA reductase-like NADH-dependent reductase (Old Yellow Enzyme family)